MFSTSDLTATWVFFDAHNGNGLLIAGQWDNAKIIKSVLLFLTGDAAK